MSRHYKKLFLILMISLPVIFFLSLALGSAEEPSEICQLCQNKAIVKEAILAWVEDPYDPNDYTLPEQFDPNYVQSGPHGTDENLSNFWTPSRAGVLDVYGLKGVPIRFLDIFAEGNMVAVRVKFLSPRSEELYSEYFQMAIYRIANGKIVEGWIAMPRFRGMQYEPDFGE